MYVLFYLGMNSDVPVYKCKSGDVPLWGGVLYGGIGFGGCSSKGGWLGFFLWC